MDALFAQVGTTLDLSALALIVGAGLLCGLILTGIYLYTHQDEGYSGGFLLSLFLMPALIALVVLMVGSNVARAFSLAGALTIIRYRSLPGNPGDILYLLFALVLGLTCGIGFIAYGLLLALVLSLVLFLLHKLKFGRRSTLMQLKITIPEELNAPHLFDSVLDTYTARWKLLRIRTCEYGSMFEQVYTISARPGLDIHAFLDALRAKNGNLGITINLSPDREWGS